AIVRSLSRRWWVLVLAHIPEPQAPGTTIQTMRSSPHSASTSTPSSPWARPLRLKQVYNRRSRVMEERLKPDPTKLREFIKRKVEADEWDAELFNAFSTYTLSEEVPARLDALEERVVSVQNYAHHIYHDLDTFKAVVEHNFRKLTPYTGE